MNLCSMEGCESSPVNFRGWCDKHYRRYRRYGDPGFRLTAANGEPLEYLRAHMYDGCSYEWPFSDSGRGYGRVIFQGKMQFAHKVSFMVGNNFTEIQKCMVVRHLCNCGHLGCFNFECLALGTSKEDAQDRIKAGTWAHGEKHGMVKLSTEQVDEIRRLYATGDYILKQLATMFNVSFSNISGIVNFKSRRNG